MLLCRLGRSAPHCGRTPVPGPQPAGLSGRLLTAQGRAAQLPGGQGLVWAGARESMYAWAPCLLNAGASMCAAVCSSRGNATGLLLYLKRHATLFLLQPPAALQTANTSAQAPSPMATTTAASSGAGSSQVARTTAAVLSLAAGAALLLLHCTAPPDD